jgi:PAS domain S-box-containing protein
LAHASPIRDERGEIAGGVNLLIDVTDRQQAADARELLAAIVQSSDDAIVSKTLEGIITSWNKGAERIFGYTAEEAIGHSITMIIPPERLSEEHDFLAKIRRGEAVDHLETVRIRKDGKLIDISVTVSPVRDRTGRIVGASKVARDITVRKRTSEALSESEDRFHTLADNIAQLAWMADPDGALFWYNKRWFDYTGTTLEQVQGSGWRQVHHPDHLNRVAQKFSQCIRKGQVWEDTFPLRGKDGTYRWFLSRAIPIRDAAGNVLRWFGTNTDITAQREAEEALRDADRRKDDFLATLAHELRNPLAPICNSLHILGLAQDLDPAVAKIREIMERQTKHLVRLVDDLLEVSRITQGKIELRTELVELAAVIRSAIETSRPMIDAGGHQLAISQPPTPVTIEADPMRLAQVFANLLNNAAKYTPPGGQIWLSASVDAGAALIEVRDNGHGIPSEMLPRIFEKFTQLDSPSSLQHGGLGIGLALARSLVEMHGGQITASSEGLGRGSRFTVRLPMALHSAPPALPAENGPATEPPPRRHFLVVDDTRDSAYILSKLLEALGNRVTTANNGREALELARSERPDVVISDIAMAEMDGYQLARLLRQEPALQHTVLVALTGYGSAADRERTKAAGFAHHLVKPVGVEALEQLFAALPRTERVR